MTPTPYGEVMAATAQTFAQIERQRAVAWKLSSATVPEGAKAPAPYVGQDGSESESTYPFCLPPEYAVVSLLPEVRDLALELFAELAIPWHAGVGHGPSNHLLSSQVQCVNALGPDGARPDRMVRALRPRARHGEVLEIEPGRYLTFEYIGDVDYFDEAPGGERVRGERSARASTPRSCTARPTGWSSWCSSSGSTPSRTGDARIDREKDLVRWDRYGAALTAARRTGPRRSARVLRSARRAAVPVDAPAAARPPARNRTGPTAPTVSGWSTSSARRTSRTSSRFAPAEPAGVGPTVSEVWAAAAAPTRPVHVVGQLAVPGPDDHLGRVRRPLRRRRDDVGSVGDRARRGITMSRRRRVGTRWRTPDRGSMTRQPRRLLRGSGSRNGGPIRACRRGSRPSPTTTTSQ